MYYLDQSEKGTAAAYRETTDARLVAHRRHEVLRFMVTSEVFLVCVWVRVVLQLNGDCTRIVMYLHYLSRKLTRRVRK